jgi:acyl dehydratase
MVYRVPRPFAAGQKIMQQKLWLEDLFVGQEFLSDAHTLTADEIKDFAGRYDPQPFI